ncbi:MAG: tRNA lysidine(34) synthetase TilS [Rickettsiales bacterium]|nr:tRNA lysidine(34) synthetase TilS [Rickettsiales bacterium]
MASLSNRFHDAMERLLPEKPQSIAVALSGGADSMALLHLSLLWAGRMGIKLRAVIVDHGLRQESAKEAEIVAEMVEQFGGHAAILTLKLEGGSAIQESAREARYKAITAWAHEQGIKHVLLAHHGDDQCETVLMRWLKQSHFDGLAGMSAKRLYQGITFLRPLLLHRKTELVGYLKSQGLHWVEDPSNQNAAFTRVAVRQFLAEQTDESLLRFTQLIQCLSMIRIRDEVLLQQIAKEHAVQFDAGFIRILPVGAPLTQLALLRAAIETIRGDEVPLRISDANQLLGMFLEDPDAKRITYHQTIIDKDKEGCLRVLREPSALPPDQPLQAVGRWDRFEYRANVVADGYRIGPLGEDGRLWLKQKSVEIPDWLLDVVRSLPTVWHLEEPVQVYHIGYVGENHKPIIQQMRFSPAKAFASAEFCAMTNR